MSSKVAACNFAPRQCVALGPGREERGRARGSRYSAPPGPLLRARAKPFAGTALADSAIAFPTMSAAPVCCAVSAAALAAPPQPPLLPERRTTSRSWAVALGRQEESRAGEAEARCRQGQPLSGSRQVWHCTSAKSKLGPNNGWLLFFPVPSFLKENYFSELSDCFFFFFT